MILTSIIAFCLFGTHAIAGEVNVTSIELSFSGSWNENWDLVSPLDYLDIIDSGLSSSGSFSYSNPGPFLSEYVSSRPFGYGYAQTSLSPFSLEMASFAQESRVPFNLYLDPPYDAEVYGSITANASEVIDFQTNGTTLSMELNSLYGDDFATGGIANTIVTLKDVTSAATLFSQYLSQLGGYGVYKNALTFPVIPGDSYQLVLSGNTYAWNQDNDIIQDSVSLSVPDMASTFLLLGSIVFAFTTAVLLATIRDVRCEGGSPADDRNRLDWPCKYGRRNPRSFAGSP